MSKKTGITITENPKNIGSSHTNFLLTPDELKTVQKSIKIREDRDKEMGIKPLISPYERKLAEMKEEKEKMSKNPSPTPTNQLLTPDELKTVQKSLKEREKQEKKVVKKMFQNNLRKKISKKVVKETPVLNTDSSPSTSSPPQVKKSKKERYR